MSRLSRQIVVFLTLFVFLRRNNASTTGPVEEPKVIRCIEAERQALLNIKHDLRFSNESLSSWGSEEEKRDCCKWRGIQCANSSGHVIKLDLSPSTLPITELFVELEGNISSSLVELRYLKHLDLSYIYFRGSPIPRFIGGFSKLRYLNLSSTSMTGEIPHRLANLSNLQVLDLHGNGLSGEIPLLLANLSRLQVLDLAYNSLTGEIPPQLANLSNLQVLDLGFNYNSDVNGIEFLSCVNNLEWLSRLSFLRELDLSFVDLSKVDDWLQIINNKLPYLTTLKLSGCKLPPYIIPSSFSFINSSMSVSHLDLSNNNISISIYQWVFNFSQSLLHLDLSYNLLRGSIPEAFGNMTQLTHLDLSYNVLQGEIPNSVWSLCTLQGLYLNSNNLSGQLPNLTQSSSKCTRYSLEYLYLSENRITGTISAHSLVSSFIRLYLSNNQLNGAVPERIGQLTQLEYLDLSGNYLKGVITEAHFSILSKLSDLDLSFNQLVLNTSSDWIPPFQLEYLNFGSCEIGPQFPKWLQTQINILRLDISNSGISESIPNWLWNLFPNLQYLNLSNNQISGTINNVPFEFQGYPLIDLSSNQLEGSVPLFLFKMSTLLLSSNNFSNIGSLCDISTDLQLNYFDISYNQLHGELPDCWSYLKSIKILVLENNKLSGKIPISFGSLTQVASLHLKDNNLIGELPLSLMNCTQLVVLDVAVNQLLGPIPTWISNMPDLVILSLRSNRFYGSIPSHLCYLQNLQLVDVSSNNLSGGLPKCLCNFTAMRKSGSIETDLKQYYETYGSSSTVSGTRTYVDEIQLVWKGTFSEYKSTLGLVKSIDISNNRMTGEIPREITELVGLVSLNLSRNNLSGEIPLEIGQLESLDALDLSLNHLVGQIPSSLAHIDRLSWLGLSHNNLSGKIPTSTQLQSLPESSYEGNPDLCGPPLPKTCQIDQDTIPKATDQEADDELLTRGFFISMGLGFVVAFWAVCGTLIFHRSFRYAYFKLFDEVAESVCVTAAIHKAKLLRMIKS